MTKIWNYDGHLTFYRKDRDVVAGMLHENVPELTITKKTEGGTFGSK